jgi:hypothetical protein
MASRLFPILIVPINVPAKVLFSPFVAVSCHPLPGDIRLPLGAFDSFLLAISYLP